MEKEPGHSLIRIISKKMVDFAQRKRWPHMNYEKLFYFYKNPPFIGCFPLNLRQILMIGYISSEINNSEIHSNMKMWRRCKDEQAETKT